MLHRTHNTREWTLVIAFSVFTLCFMLWVLLESRGTVQYPQWHTVKGHDYYQVFDRTLLPIFPICVFTVDLFVAGLTLWGLHRGGIFGQLFHWVRYSVADGDKLSNVL